MIVICNECSNNKHIVVSENKCTFAIENVTLSAVNKVKVDGCYIDDGVKCDFLFEILEGCEEDGDPEKVFYVELKGTDIQHAVKQLESTIHYCRSIHMDVLKECHIVASRYPKSAPSTQVVKKSFKDRNHLQLFIGTVKTVVKI